MGGLGKNANTSTPTVLPDDFDGFFGQRRSGDSFALITEANEGNYINPNYKRGSKDGYSTNCAICATAVPLQARGYDVEALTQPEKGHMNWRHIFDVDYTNPDNYMVHSSKHHFYLDDRGIRASASRQLQERGMNYDERQKYLNSMNIQKTPRGANKVAQAIEDKVKGWGDGAIGVIYVKWQGRNSAHDINVINRNGKVSLYDAQSNKFVTDLKTYFGRTDASSTELIRLDNAPIKKDAKQYINKMFKKRGS